MAVNLPVQKQRNKMVRIPPEEKLLTRIAEIVYNQQRPVSFKDLLSFEFNGQPIKYTYGSLRNLISKLLQQDMIEVVCKSPQAFYTLKGVNVGKMMTPYSIVGNAILNHKQRGFIKSLGILELNNPAIHDIRLWFSCKGLREIILQSNSDLIDHVDKKDNKNIYLKKVTQDDITLTTVIHNTDTVSIEIKCSENPISVDTIGLSILTSLLARVEERLQRIIDEYNNAISIHSTPGLDIPVRIPNLMTWTVKMWHFGYDSEPRLNGEKFELSWKETLEAFRIYSKKRRTNTM
jgi:hypothetical protein